MACVFQPCLTRILESLSGLSCHVTIPSHRALHRRNYTVCRRMTTNNNTMLSLSLSLSSHFAPTPTRQLDPTLGLPVPKRRVVFLAVPQVNGFDYCNKGIKVPGCIERRWCLVTRRWDLCCVADHNQNEGFSEPGHDRHAGTCSNSCDAAQPQAVPFNTTRQRT